VKAEDYIHWGGRQPNGKLFKKLHFNGSEEKSEEESGSEKEARLVLTDSSENLHLALEIWGLPLSELTAYR
jgi:hypothetical protein